jgi:hypothetical protein
MRGKEIAAGDDPTVLLIVCIVTKPPFCVIYV